MKKIFIVGINILFLLVLTTPLAAHAECVNNVDTVSGRTCLVITKNSSGAGTNIGTVCNGPYGTCTYTPLEPIPGVQQSGNVNFAAFLSSIFKILISIGGLFAVVMIVVAGIGYMISESAVDIDKAKHRAIAALWGLMLLAGCWLILNTINPDLLKFDFSSLGQLRGNNPGAYNVTTNPAATTAQNNTDRAQCENRGQAYAQNASGIWGCSQVSP